MWNENKIEQTIWKKTRKFCGVFFRIENRKKVENIGRKRKIRERRYGI